MTVNRLCASGLSAVVGACHAVAAGDGDLFVAGGVESMSRAPLVMAKPDKAFPRGNQHGVGHDARLALPESALEAMFPLESMGETGENVAERWEVSREDQDAFARRVAAAVGGSRRGRTFADELRAGRRRRSATSTRGPDTTGETLAALKPAFRGGGTVTAGNSSGLNDGAAALVVATRGAGARARRRAAGRLRRGRRGGRRPRA